MSAGFTGGSAGFAGGSTSVLFLLTLGSSTSLVARFAGFAAYSAASSSTAS